MQLKVLKILSSIIILFLLTGCAQMGALTGGDRDTTPPKLLLAVPDLKTTLFNSEQITLTFDENIQLKDLNNQLAISPKLTTKPNVTALGKKIIIQFKKNELLPNTTYRFYFGNAISDMHEGNPLPNFTYIFSTGEFIDTLSIKGTILNAYKKTPEKDIVIGLYYNQHLGDSFPFKQVPDYVTKSTESGDFKIENLPPKEYRLICFSDKNKDYLYNNPETDMIGFESNSLLLKNDTSIELNLFNEIPDRTYIKKQLMSENGKGTLLFNKKTEIKLVPFINSLKNDFTYNLKKETDTCVFYYRNITDSLWLLASYKSSGNAITDTLMLKIPVIKTKNKKLLKADINTKNGSIGYFQKPILTFHYWIDTSIIQISKIKFMSKQDTTIKNASPLLRWISPNSVQFENIFKEKTSYTIKLDSGAFMAHNGLYNDSLMFNFNIADKKEYASLLLNITFNIKQPYLIYLINNNGNIVREDSIKFSLSSSNTHSVKYNQLFEGAYKLMIVYDNNNNGKWDTGNFLKNQQPEKVFVFEQTIKAIPNWELVEDFILKE